MSSPKVSIVMPVYNVEKYLDETIGCLKRQSLKDFEVIFVDDGSTDNSVQILEACCSADKRFSLVTQHNAGAGAARNIGIKKAAGDYVIFLDSDDLFEDDLLECSYDYALETGADVVAFDFCKFDTDGHVDNRKGVHDNWLNEKKAVFNYQDCPDFIMSIVNPTPWNKLYKRSFVLEKELKFEEISSTNDITFASVSIANAEKVAYLEKKLVKYRIGHGGTITSTKTKNLNNIIVAVTSAMRQARTLPYCAEIEKSIQRFAVENYIFAMEHYIANFSDPQVKAFYDYVHEAFNGADFANVTADSLHNNKMYRAFVIVQKQDYETMRELIARKMIVSFTTYPKRIGTINKIVENVWGQTRKPEKLLLYLAEEQFPEKEKELPEELMQQVNEGLVEIKWCDDLRSHKKYYYAMQEYKDSLIVTIDDDLIYPDDMLQKLYDSYLQFPECISAMRVHMCIADEYSRQVMPYSVWMKECRNYTLTPSSQMFATSGAGTLYPPASLHPLAFSSDKIFSLCPYADDIWLHIMTVINGKRTVLADSGFYLKYIEGTQEESLQNINVADNQNEVQYAAVQNWLKDEFGRDIVYDMLLENAGDLRCASVAEICAHFSSHFSYYTKSMRNSLNQAWHDKAERGVKINEQNKQLKRQGKRIAELEIEIARRDRFNIPKRLYRAIKRHGVKQMMSIALGRVKRIVSR